MCRCGREECVGVGGNSVQVWEGRVCRCGIVSCPDPTLSRGKGSGDH